MSSFFAETHQLNGLHLRFVTVDFTYALEHSSASSFLSAEASRVADVLVSALVVERICQKENRL